MQRSVSIFGATGSIGKSTIDLVARDPRRWPVVALTANGDWKTLAAQARLLRPQIAVVADESALPALRDALAGTGVETSAGSAALIEAAARPADWVMAAIVGAAGLAPTLKAVEQGGIVAIANKESLVCAGDIVVETARRNGTILLPVDSEHNAIFQVFDFKQPESVRRIILTASGGPFRTASVEDMRRATRAQAVSHPVWSMGAKISVDSATLMNKGLELIEAYHLFPVRPEQLDVVVHPQSVVHSFVEYRDGSLLAQLGTPDMRTPIGYALGWPERIETPCAPLDLVATAQLTFEAPDRQRFPALDLARAALVAGGSVPVVLNAANEVAVQAFLDGAIGFLDIAAIVTDVMTEVPHTPVHSLEDVRAVDDVARRIAAVRAIHRAA